MAAIDHQNLHSFLVFPDIGQAAMLSPGTEPGAPDSCGQELSRTLVPGLGSGLLSLALAPVVHVAPELL